MKKGTRVYTKGAPYRGMGTVIGVKHLSNSSVVTVRWDSHGGTRLHWAEFLCEVRYR